MIKLIISILLILQFQNLYSQSPKVKKKTVIKNDYYFKIYSDGKIRIDTFIIEYEQNGNQKKQPKYLSSIPPIKIVFLDSTKIINSDKNLVHKREFWSDSTTINIFTITSENTISKISIKNKDTIKIRKVYFEGKAPPEFRLQKIESLINRFSPYQLTLKFENAKKTTIFIREKSGFSDSLKISTFFTKNNYEKSIYNPEKREWFVKEKVILKKRKKIVSETFYHEDHKQYFTSKRVLYFNKYNQLIKETEYDHYSFLVNESHYDYEYY